MARVMPAPDRTDEQRMAALKRANVIRSRRSRLKREIKSGRASVLDSLCSDADWLATMKVFDLLKATPQIGRVKANRVLQRCRVSPSKTIGGLSSRQRQALVDDLTANGPQTIWAAA